ncbi:cytochrome P450 7B1-like [Styela clava]
MDVGLGTAILFVLNVVLLIFVLFRRRRRPGEPPIVPHTYPIIGAALEFGRNPLGYLRNLRQEYGDVFTVELAGWNVHFFTNPVDVKYLEKNRILKHDKVLYDFATRVVGSPHAIDVSGKHNPRGPEVMAGMTKAMRGSTSLSKLTESCLTITTYAFEQALRKDERFIQEQPIGLYELAGKIIFDTTLYMFFGYHKSLKQRLEEKNRFYDDFMFYFEKSALLVDRVSINLLPKVKAARNRLLEEMNNIEFKNRVGVSELIKSMNEIDKNNADERARHLLIILWSSQANSRPALFWTLFHLLKQPQAVAKILQEYNEVMEMTMSRQKKKTNENIPDRSLLSEWLGMDDIMELNRTSLDKIVILDACIRESLRLVGSSMIVREVDRNAKVTVASGNKYLVRKGDFTAFFSPLTHMDEVIHENPEEYMYERHLVEQISHRDESSEDISDVSSICSTDSEGLSKKNRLKAKIRYGVPGYRVSASRAILTFGYGTNRCPGRHIALIEIKLCVLIFLRHFRLELLNPDEKPPPFDMRHLGFGVMPPLSDVLVKISPKVN